MAGFSGAVSPTRPLISIIHPVRHIHPSSEYPIAWRGAHDAWLARCDDPRRVEYVISVRDEEFEAFTGSAMLISCPKYAWFQFITVRLEGRDSLFQATAQAVRSASGTLLTLAQDDEQPPEHWDRLLFDGDARVM